MINYSRLSRAIDSYTNQGYRHIEVPWYGSTEQSLIQLASRNKIEPHQAYIAVNPCFRDDAIDAEHKEYFMKAELFYYCDDYDLCRTVFKIMLNDAFELFKVESGRDVQVDIKGEETDLLIGGIDVGSYGVRKHDNIYWAYGTGIAEPRFSYVIGET